MTWNRGEAVPSLPSPSCVTRVLSLNPSVRTFGRTLATGNRFSCSYFFFPSTIGIKISSWQERYIILFFPFLFWCLLITDFYFCFITRISNPQFFKSVHSGVSLGSQHMMKWEIWHFHSSVKLYPEPCFYWYGISYASQIKYFPMPLNQCCWKIIPSATKKFSFFLHPISCQNYGQKLYINFAWYLHFPRTPFNVLMLIWTILILWMKDFFVYLKS